MAKTNFAIKRSLSLDTSLRERLLQTCQLLRPSPKDDKRNLPHHEKPFVAKECHHLGVCVCTQYPDAKWFFHNLMRHFRTIFAKKKKTPTLARKIMEKHGIVFKFSPCTKTETQDVGQTPNDWDIAYHESAFDGYKPIPVEDAKKLQEFYFHIGYINFKTFHFSCLQLQVEEHFSDRLPNRLQLLSPVAAESAELRLGLYTDMEVFAYLLDLSFSWKITILTIADEAGDWSLLRSCCLAVVPVDGLDEFIVWHGSTEEASRRKMQEELERAARAAKDAAKERKNKGTGRGRKRANKTVESSENKKRARTKAQSRANSLGGEEEDDDILDLFAISADNVVGERDVSDDDQDRNLLVDQQQDDTAFGNVYDDIENDSGSETEHENDVAGEMLDEKSNAPESSHSALSDNEDDELQLRMDDKDNEDIDIEVSGVREEAALEIPDPQESQAVATIGHSRPRELGGTRSTQNRFLNNYICRICDAMVSVFKRLVI